MIVRKGNTATPQSLVYNAENRLVRLASTGSNLMLVTFGYDAGGARLWKWNNQSPTNLQVWIGNYYEEKGGKTLFHIFANGQQVCTFETNSALYNGSSTDTNHVAYYYSEDNINSSCALSSGATPTSQQEVNVYYPFGRTAPGNLQASFQVSRRFTGQILDAESGLYYYNARYYDPELGRFTQPDTTIPDISNPQSYNRYAYCVNNPLRYNDPDGRAPSDWANAWSSAINRGACYVSAGPSHWIWNGTVGSLNTLVGGLAEPLRFGSTAGALSGSGHATAGQIALGTLQEAGRAAAIVPVGAAIGKGTGALVTSLTAGGEEEAVGELSGLLSSSCFVAGTFVVTANGYVEIQDVKVGDLVWSYSLQAQEWQMRPVEATPLHDYTGDIITINVSGPVIQATGNHPFWVISGGNLANRPMVGDLSKDDQTLTPFGRWVEARSIAVGDQLLLLNGGTATVSSLSERQDHLLVYNLHVTGNHTYAVSQAGVLVHNKSAQIKPVPRDLPNANQALRDAKEAWDIPKSAQPDKTIKPGTPEGNAAGLDERNVKLYEYSNSRGEKIHVRQDKPATYNQNGAGDQGPHFNSGPAGEKLQRHDYYDPNK
jgi:RHS repeat-associated protein